MCSPRSILMPSPFRTHESMVQVFGKPINPLSGYLFFYIPYYLDHVKLDSRFFKSLVKLPLPNTADGTVSEQPFRPDTM
jgi:hypothetical protein